MKHRTLPNTGLRVSEIGFGLWTLATEAWPKVPESDAIRLLRRALDLGINYFETADIYGNGYSEELLARAFGRQRDQIVVGAKIGYDIYGYEEFQFGKRGITRNLTPPFIAFAVEKTLKRLNTDRIDILQLHHLGMDTVRDDGVWTTLDRLRREGKILSHGIAPGPGLGWLYETVDCIQQRQPAVVEHVYNLLEPFPGKYFFAAAYGKLSHPEATAEDLPKFAHGRMESNPEFDTRLIVRGPHCSGLLEGRIHSGTVFPPNDPRSQGDWLKNGLRKAKALDFLTGRETGRTLAQAALLWALAEPTVACCLPNIANIGQLEEFAEAPERNALTVAELEEADDRSKNGFGVETERLNYQGTMKREYE